MSEVFKTLEEYLIINMKQLKLIKESMNGTKDLFEAISTNLERMRVLIEMVSESFDIEMEDK